MTTSLEQSAPVALARTETDLLGGVVCDALLDQQCWLEQQAERLEAAVALLPPASNELPTGDPVHNQIERAFGDLMVEFRKRAASLAAASELLRARLAPARQREPRLPLV